jgi:DNA-binding LacI/PurR family transcriptional regulator/DNA-binding transcriptional regulator YhcF (GntR family)
VAKQSTTPVPAYVRIEDHLRDKICGGEWPAGAMLPSRRDLAREYDVSSLTVDRAVTRLIAEGLLRADSRRGTFVTAVEVRGAASPLLHRQATPASAPGADPDLATDLSPSRAPAAISIVASLHLGRDDHVELNNFWVRLLLQSLEHACSDEGSTTAFFNRVQAPPGHPLVPLGEAIDAAAGHGADAVAVIALDVDPREVDESLSVLDGRGVPVVCVTLGELSRPVPHLFYENRSAGYQATEHLLRRGSRDILFLTPFMASWVKERLEGVHAAVAHARLPSEAVRVFPRRVGSWVLEEDPEDLGYQAGRAAFAEGMVQTGVVCVNDGVALGFLRAAAERGLEPGRDFAVVSFDDHPDARTVGLTTLRPPMEMLGKETARLLWRARQGETTDLQVRLRSHLIPRRSTRCVRT